VGPHRVRIDKVGYQYAERSVEVVNGQDASLQVTLAPTDETQARLDSSRSTRRAVAWTTLVGGVALVAAGAITAVVENSALSTARSDFNTNVTQKEIPGALCDKTLDPQTLSGLGCDATHSYYQDRIDKAQTLRIVGIAVAGVGVAAAAVGGYLLSTVGSSGGASASASTSGAGVTSVAAWTGAGVGGLVLTGRF